MEEILDICIIQSKEINNLYLLIDNLIELTKESNNELYDNFVEMVGNTNDNVKTINTRLTSQDLEIQDNNRKEEEKMDKLKTDVNKVLLKEKETFKNTREDLGKKMDVIKNTYKDNLRQIKLLKVDVDKNNINKQLMDKINGLKEQCNKYEDKLKEYDSEVKSLRNEMRLSRREKFKEKKVGNGIKIIK